MKKISLIAFIGFVILSMSIWIIVSKGYDRQNKVILTIKQILPSHLARQIRDTIFFIPDMKRRNEFLSLQVEKYEQELEGKIFNTQKIKTKNNEFELKEYFLPFPRLDTRLGWAATENSKRAHYLEIVGDKVLVISGLGQTIYFNKNKVISESLNQIEIPNNLNFF